MKGLANKRKLEYQVNDLTIGRQLVFETVIDDSYQINALLAGSQALTNYRPPAFTEDLKKGLHATGIASWTTSSGDMKCAMNAECKFADGVVVAKLAKLKLAVDRVFTFVGEIFLGPGNFGVENAPPGPVN
jgi:hypothetical protein